jgi:hypothetical protein
MLYRTLTKELPQRVQAQRPKKKASAPRVITISLINPPHSYRMKNKKSHRYIVRLMM